MVWHIFLQLHEILCYNSCQVILKRFIKTAHNIFRGWKPVMSVGEKTNLKTIFSKGLMAESIRRTWEQFQWYLQECIFHLALGRGFHRGQMFLGNLSGKCNLSLKHFELRFPESHFWLEEEDFLSVTGNLFFFYIFS